MTRRAYTRARGVAQTHLGQRQGVLWWRGNAGDRSTPSTRVGVYGTADQILCISMDSGQSLLHVPRLKRLFYGNFGTTCGKPTRSLAACCTNLRLRGTCRTADGNIVCFSPHLTAVQTGRALASSSVPGAVPADRARGNATPKGGTSCIVGPPGRRLVVAGVTEKTTGGSFGTVGTVDRSVNACGV